MSRLSAAAAMAREETGLLAAGRSQAASLALGLLAWEVLARWLRFPFLPAVSKVAGAGWRLLQSGEILGNLRISLASLATGYVLAVVLGVSVAAWMGSSRLVEWVLDPYLTALLASPSLIFAPVLFALFGVSRGSQTALVFLYSFFVITSNTLTGMHAAQDSLMEMGRSFGADGRQLFWKVRLPGSMPMILAGLHIGFARAVKGMINGEMLIALVGLGALVRTYGGRFEADKVLAIVAVVVAVGWAGTALLEALERHLTRWAVGTTDEATPNTGAFRRRLGGYGSR